MRLELVRSRRVSWALRVCIRLLPDYRNYVWCHSFVQDRTHSGSPFRILPTATCLTINLDAFGNA